MRDLDLFLKEPDQSLTLKSWLRWHVPVFSQIEDENSQKITSRVWLVTNHKQIIGSLFVARVLLEDKVPSFTTQESFHNSVIELGGWGWLEQGLFTRYRMFHVLLSPISELTWHLTSESDLPVAREIILTRVIKCLNLNVVSCSSLCDRWSEWAVLAWTFSSAEKKKSVLSF